MTTQPDNRCQCCVGVMQCPCDMTQEDLFCDLCRESPWCRLLRENAARLSAERMHHIYTENFNFNYDLRSWPHGHTDFS